MLHLMTDSGAGPTQTRVKRTVNKNKMRRIEHGRNQRLSYALTDLDDQGAPIARIVGNPRSLLDGQRNEVNRVIYTEPDGEGKVGLRQVRNATSAQQRRWAEAALAEQGNLVGKRDRTAFRKLINKLSEAN